MENAEVGKLIDGKGISQQICAELQKEVTELKEKTKEVPTLCVVLVGDRKDSLSYVKQKQKAAEDSGIKFMLSHLPVDITQEKLLEIVAGFNADQSINGIIVQLPLPGHINEKHILDAVSLEKDVDGFHPNNIGNLALKGRDPLFVPCTAKGCIELLDRLKLPIDGKHAVVLGRSNIVYL